MTTNQLAWRLIEALRALTGETSALIGKVRGQLKALRGRLPSGKLTPRQRRLMVLQLSKQGKWPTYIRDYVTALLHELRLYTPPRHRKLLDRQGKLGASLARRLTSDLKAAIRSADTTTALDAVITHLADRVGKWQALAKRIVVTEIVRSANAEVISSLGNGDKVRWDATLDRRVCRSCASADGEVREYGEAFSIGVVAPPAHPNCFHPDTRIGGSVVGALKARYSGPMVELQTARGGRLSVTPNHPILTGTGWKRAGDIAEGDELGANIIDSHLGVVGVDEYDAPARACEVFDFLLERFRSVRTATTARDLHGDAQFGDGQVDIVDGRGVLEHEWQPGMLDDFSQPVATGGSLTLDRDGSSPLLGYPHSAASGCQVCGGDLPSSVGSGHLGPFDGLSLGLISGCDTHIPKPPHDHGSNNAILLRQLIDAAPLMVGVDKVSGVRTFMYDGHVYDFQSSTGWVSASGIIASNCRCLLIRVASRRKR